MIRETAKLLIVCCAVASLATGCARAGKDAGRDRYTVTDRELYRSRVDGTTVYSRTVTGHGVRERYTVVERPRSQQWTSSRDRPGK